MMRRILYVAVPVVLGLGLLAGCGEEDPNPVTNEECLPGTLECACGRDNFCPPGSFCSPEGICDTVSCAVGSDGCACFANGTCDVGADGILLDCVDGLCAVSACEPGSEGCPCVGGACIGSDLTCSVVDGAAICVAAACPPGAEGCTCPADWECDVTLDGQLGCDGARCVQAECELGTEGCFCDRARACDAGLLCDRTSWRCEPPLCTPGTGGCECAAGDACFAGASCLSGRCVPAGCTGADGDEGCLCVDGACMGELDCMGGVCVDAATIPVGERGGQCLTGGTCNGINRCDNDSFTCVACTMGGEGCLCRSGSTACDAGLACAGGRCVSEASLLPTPPADPVCYTPCSEGMELPDGSFRTCSAQGLMAGCIAGRECVDGSCVEPGEDPPTCLTDLECPDYQRCMSGRCYSECEFDTDCSAGLSCNRKVCRVACTPAGDECGAGQFCSTTTDNSSGYCMTLRSPDDVPVVRDELTYDVSPTSIALNNTRTSGSFTIYNPSDRAMEFTIRKLGHTEYTDAGLVPVGFEDADGDGLYDGNPLQWIRMGGPGAVRRQQAFEVIVDAGESLQIAIADAANDALLRWDGVIEISNEKLGTRRVRMEYSTRPDGQWTGTAYYFLNFDDTELATWLSNPSNALVAQNTNNAFIAKWASFRSNSLFALNELLAVIGATTSGSWNYPAVREACADVFGDSVERQCYLYTPDDVGPGGDAGVRIYSADVQNLRIPTGVVEMPFAINVALAEGSTTRFEGRINTAQALQYPGNPPAELVFENDPALCARSGDACVQFVDRFDAQILLGGRFLPGPTTSCTDIGANFAATSTPWLVPSFLEGTTLSETVGRIYTECRESTFPYDPALSTYASAQNASLAAANPIPDGRARIREVSLLDGALINQETLVLVVRETYPTFLGAGDGSDSFSAYGVIVLEKATADLDEDAYIPGLVPDEDELVQPDGLLELTCSDELVQAALGRPTARFDSLSSGDASDLAVALIAGVPDGAELTEVTWSDTSSGYGVHYVCHDTGRINGGPSAWRTSAEGPEPCPLGSGVTYFLLPNERASFVNSDSCQSGTRCVSSGDSDLICEVTSRGTCMERVSEWAANPAIGAILDPPYSCLDEAGFVDHDSFACDDETRRDMRTEKVFYVPTGSREAFAPLRAAISDAFRYKTRFRNRSGRTVGFVPAVCTADADSVPYCYDPAAIEDIRERIDCLVATYRRYDTALAGAQVGYAPNRVSVQTFVREFLEGNFSFEEVPGASVDTLPNDGFERLYSELLIMLADDAYTRSLASRFDLAGSAIGAFDGDLFEPNGIRLSGGAGYQMRLLYQSMQYHTLVLNRFYRMLPDLWQVLREPAQNFVNIDTVTTYLNRLILASTKKAQVASELARLYQSFNRADLARHVIERSYAETYLESVVLGQFIRRTAAVVDRTSLAQIQMELDTISRQYRVAMQRMREDYQNLTDELNYFGFAPDYIPFPALRPSDSDAVSVQVNRALESLRTAREREDRALESTRAFDVDAAQFQAELTRVRNQYEDQLAEVCGTFRDTEGDVYPAIPKYSGLNEALSLFGDPCGLVGNGAIYQAIGDVDSRNFDLRIAVRSIEEVIERAQIERQRGLDSCGGLLDIATLQYEAQGEIITLEDEIRGLNNDIAEYNREIGMIDRQTALAQSTAGVFQATAAGGSLGGGVVSAIAGAAATIVAGVNYNRIRQKNEDIEDREEDIRDNELVVANLERANAYEQQLRQCCLDATEDDPDACDSPGPMLIDSAARVDTIMVELKRAELNAMRADLELQLAIGRLDALRNQADRLIAQQEESEQLLINVEAARNDPNIRIYRNSAIIDADRTFDAALQDAYRATLVYEYYTTTSYARRDELFLARMVARGDYNLENYVIDLQRAFREFEELYGLASPRVHVLSLRDDIFRVPELDPSGRAYTQAERVDLFREMLTDVKLLDDRGYIAIPLATSLAMTSPLTAAHKLLRLEAEIIGSDVGDRVGRIYFTQRGTSTVRTVADGLSYYRLPQLTAVINTYFNGVKVDTFGSEVYANQRLRDRPFVNSLWELGINQRDEAVNADINLNSLTDIRVYLFYSDFTELE